MYPSLCNFARLYRSTVTFRLVHLEALKGKRMVVKCLMDWVDNIPSCDSEKDLERQKVLSDLKVNGYPNDLIEKCCIPKPPTTVQIQDADTRSRAFATIPYIKAVSKQIRNILNRAIIKTAFQPVKMLK